jgi:hypothetical protein
MFSPAGNSVVVSSEMIRTLAHELRQPLSTIESIAYYLTLILPEDEKTREQLDRIQQLVEQSNWMLNSAQLLSDSVSGTRESIDLANLVPEGAGVAHGDASLRGAIENLAILYRQFAEPRFFRAASAADGALLEMEAGGPTFPGALLSLNAARRVVEAHGGSFDAQIDASGIRLRVMLT